MLENETEGFDPLGLYDQNKTSCLTTAFSKNLSSVCVFGRVS